MGKVATHFIINGRAEEAARFYTSIFKNSRIHEVARSGDGSVTVVTFEIEGQQFIALNDGPDEGFTMATSIFVNCDSQDEVDEVWAKLSEGGQESMCGWVTDKFGLSWQVIPSVLPKLLNDPDPEKSGRVMSAMCAMKKIDIRRLEDAYANA